MKRLALAVLLAASATARAEWSANLQFEGLRWTEKSGPPDIVEKGTRLGVGWGWLQEEGAQRIFLRYRGAAYAGSTNQKSTDSATGLTRQGTTDYVGLVNEAQLIYRDDGHGSLNPMAGIGLDYWVRTLPFTRREQDWRVLFARFGLEVGAWRKRGVSLSAGIKFPLWTSINAHFVEAGFNENPAIEPPGAISGYAEIGYRFSQRWKLSAHYDGYRFGQSPDVNLTSPTATANQARTSIDSYGVRLHYFF